MEPMLEINNTGQREETAENNTDNQNGESRQPRNLQHVAKRKEPHPTHHFKWRFNSKTPTSVTCNKVGTVEDSLKRSSQFREIAKKNNNKELVVLRNRRAVSLHFPCSLIKDACLTIKYIKPVDKPKQPDRGSVQKRKGSSGELVMFHVHTKGGKNVTKIMRNPALNKVADEITVYAYIGETVKQALKSDAHFLSKVFSKNCALFDTSTEVNIEMSNLVDHLDGKTYKVILLNKASPPESQPGSLDDACLTLNGSERSDCDPSQNLSQQSTTTETVDDNAPQLPGKIFKGIPGSEETQCRLSSQIKYLMRGKKPVPKLSRLQNAWRAEFGKNTQTCMEVKTMKKLMELSDSVCHVRVNGRPEGTGFLLFDKFVLTNGHVLKNIYNENRGLDEKVTVHFSYESLNQTERGQGSGAEVEVQGVAGYEYGRDVSGHMYDWALLILRANQALPDTLLTHFGFLPKSGGICIIGHPDGGVKKIDPCLIIPSDSRNQAVEKHYHANQGHIELITTNFFEDVAKAVEANSQVLTYDTCLYHGSSGSPVFDKHCRVVAVHSGGHPYCNDRGERQGVMEFGYPLSCIVEHILVQLVERMSFDVLRSYLACSYTHQQHVMSGLKKLVESRNLPAFKNALDSSAVTGDQSLRSFFEFFSQTEEPVPMDISYDADN